MNTQPSSRTPEGEDNRCIVCGHDVRIDPTRPPGDAPCPNCGTLLWFAEIPQDTPQIRQAAILWERANAAIAHRKLAVAMRLLQQAILLDPANEQFKTTLSQLQSHDPSLNPGQRRRRRRRTAG